MTVLWTLEWSRGLLCARESRGRSKDVLSLIKNWRRIIKSEKFAEEQSKLAADCWIWFTGSKGPHCPAAPAAAAATQTGALDGQPGGAKRADNRADSKVKPMICSLVVVVVVVVVPVLMMKLVNVAALVMN